METISFGELEHQLHHNPQFLTCDLADSLPTSSDVNLPKPSRTKGVAHIKVGISANDEVLPSFYYGLLDSGCSDNLISHEEIRINRTNGEDA